MQSVRSKPKLAIERSARHGLCGDRSYPHMKNAASSARSGWFARLNSEVGAFASAAASTQLARKFQWACRACRSAPLSQGNRRSAQLGFRHLRTSAFVPSLGRIQGKRRRSGTTVRVASRHQLATYHASAAATRLS